MARAANTNVSDAQESSSHLLAINAALLLRGLLSAFATIYSTHACRALYARLQTLESDQWYLQEDYGRLVLEQSTQASHYRVESIARGDLGMTEPDLGQYKVVAK